jgi:uncharacterized protein involved in exopolysaccharide biosynthesis
MAPPRRSAGLVILVLVFGGIGALIGHQLRPPVFRAKAQILFRMTLPDMRSDNPEPIANYPYFVNSQIQIITSPTLIETAMQLPVWKTLGRPDSKDAIKDFGRNLKVARIPDSEIVDVSFTDLDEDAARAGAEAICNAYQNFVDDSDPQGFHKRYQYWNDKENELGNELANEQLKFDGVVKDAGTDDVSELVKDNLIDANKKRLALNDAEFALDSVQQTYATQQAQPPATRPAEMTDSQIALIDPVMAMLIRKQVEERVNLALLERSSGQNDPQARASRAQLDAIEQTIRDESDSFMDSYHGPWPVVSDSGQIAMPHALTPADVNTARMNVETAKSQYAQQTAYTKRLSVQSQELTEERAKITSLTGELNEAKRYIEDLSTKIESSERSGIVDVLSHGDLPTERTTGRTIKWSLLGSALGALAPIALLLLYRGLTALVGR